MPVPPWNKRGRADDGNAAWQRLSGADLSRGPCENISIYLHIPFCDRRCRFCDCIAKPLPKGHGTEEDAFVEHLESEMEAWASIEALRQRPVTTVHCGGGTPNLLAPARFDRVLDRLRSLFGITPHTELALESTSSLLDDEHLRALHDRGFSRLHVGVQTLDPALRGLLGRRDVAAHVERRLASAIAQGFVVSVDVIYGLPAQTIEVFCATLERVVRLRVHGVSLYHLHRTERFSRYLSMKGIPVDPNNLAAFVQYHAGDRMLSEAGYHKTHFAHYSLPADRNLYSTHVTRGEDLLAMGPSADGIFGNYRYRHLGIDDYQALPVSGRPFLEGGMEESAVDVRLRPLVAALMAGSVAEGLIEKHGARDLLRRWEERCMLEADQVHHTWRLTANGSWFVSAMIDELMSWQARGQPDGSPV